MTPEAPEKSSLDKPTPAPPLGEDMEMEIDLDDSAELTQENMRALLARAKKAAQNAAKETKIAFNTTQALADTGMLRTANFHKKKNNGA